MSALHTVVVKPCGKYMGKCVWFDDMSMKYSELQIIGGIQRSFFLFLSRNIL